MAHALTSLPLPRWRSRWLAAAVAVLCLTGTAARGADAPAVPCAGGQPAFPPLDAEPIVAVVHGGELGVWTPPACTAWPAGKFDLLGTTTARFRFAGDAAGLLPRFAEVSHYPAIRYWSPSRDQRWPLAFEAFALTDADAGHARADFTAAELRPGTPLYFWWRMATERRIPGLGTVALVNRIDVLELTAGRLVLGITSEPARVALLLTLHRGDIRTLYVIESEPDTPDVWRYFTLTGLSGLAAADADDFVRNSARGIFRYTAGLAAEVLPGR